MTELYTSSQFFYFRMGSLADIIKALRKDFLRSNNFPNFALNLESIHIVEGFLMVPSIS